MINLSPEHALMFGVLTVIGCIAIMMVCLRAISKNLEAYRKVRDNRKEFKSKMKEKEAMTSNGDFHEWITMITGTGEMMVCKKTGWCPQIKGFIRIEYVNEFVKRQEMEENYRLYRNKKIKELSDKYDMKVSSFEKVIEDVFKIKEGFINEDKKSSVINILDRLKK